MTIKYDKVADAVYVKINEFPVSSTVPLSDSLILDKDATGNIVGLEILKASLQTDLLENLKQNYETFSIV